MTDSPEDRQDLVIDLNFVPSWARNPPKSPYAAFEDQPDSRPRRWETDGRDARRGERRPRQDRRPSERRPEPGNRRPDRAPFRRETDYDRRDRRPVTPAPPPIAAEFVAERKGLAPIVRRISLSGRAYSLFDIASLFLSKPEYYAVKVTVEDSGPPLFLCEACQALFADEAGALAHGLDRHFDQFYRKDEVEVEPPKGHFTCVARCGLSGELIGPPNYHGYNDALHALHHARYPNLSLEQYRRHVQNMREPELIEQWKQKMSRKTVYHTVEAGQPATFERFADVEAHFREHYARRLIHSGRRFVVPGTATPLFDDPAIKQILRDTWNREIRFPIRMAINLRLAFRHMGLHLFKTADGGTFVTSIVPASIDPNQAVPVIRETLECLAAEPGCRCERLIERLRPGVAPDSPEAAEVRRQLRWLIDKGHVIEFSDGRMAVPLSAVHIQHARRHGERPKAPPGRRVREGGNAKTGERHPPPPDAPASLGDSAPDQPRG